MSTKQLNWKKVKGGEYFTRVGSLWLIEKDIDCYSPGSWERFELYIYKVRNGKWYICSEQHTDEDFDQVYFSTLKEAQEYLQDFAEHILYCYQEQMAEEDDARRLAELQTEGVFQESGVLSQDYIDVLSEIDSNDNEPDGDDLHYPSEIDSPDYEPSEIDSPDYDRLVDQLKADFANGDFLKKDFYYMDLLKISRYQFDQFLIYEFDLNHLENPLEIQIDEAKVYQRLIELYSHPDEDFIIPSNPNAHLMEYLDRLDPDGRMIVKTQLNLFGEV